MSLNGFAHGWYAASAAGIKSFDSGLRRVVLEFAKPLRCCRKRWASLCCITLKIYKFQ